MGPADCFTFTSSRGVQWFLHSKNVTLRIGREQTIYYFAREARENACELPAGFDVVETARTGMPVLKRN